MASEELSLSGQRNSIEELVECWPHEITHPLNILSFCRGDPVPDWLLARAIDAASRGKITSVGMELYLIPVWVYVRAEKEAVVRATAYAKNHKTTTTTRPAPTIKTSDCTQLSQLLPNKRNQKKATNRKYDVSTSMISRPPEAITVTPLPCYREAIKCDRSCLACGANLGGKRSDAKFCNATCRQRFSRSRGRS